MNAADVLLSPARSLPAHNEPALIAGDRKISYPELDALACQAAGAMQALGVDCQDRVMLLIEDRPEFFIV